MYLPLPVSLDSVVAPIDLPVNPINGIFTFLTKVSCLVQSIHQELLIYEVIVS